MPVGLKGKVLLIVMFEKRAGGGLVDFGIGREGSSASWLVCTYYHVPNCEPQLWAWDDPGAAVG